MLVYHPALDPYHSAFRMLRLLLASTAGSLEIDKIRILDFYLTFPSQLLSLTVTRPLMKRRSTVAGKPNIYKFNGHPILVFAQMRPLQETALHLLSSSGIIRRDEFLRGVVTLSEVSKNQPLAEAAAARNAANSELMSFLVSDLGTMPLSGQDGLKSRSKLMEHRYDPI